MWFQYDTYLHLDLIVMSCFAIVIVSSTYHTNLSLPCDLLKRYMLQVISISNINNFLIIKVFQQPK
jgi:hypothetical protein